MYEPNSHKSKERKERPRMKSVVKSSTNAKKPSIVRKVWNAFFPEDVESMKDYILLDVIIPALKDAAEDTFHATIRGVGSPRKKTRYDHVSSKVSYASDDRRRTDYTNRRNAIFNYDEVIFDTRDDAEIVLTTMEEALAAYEEVTVLDFYDLSGRTIENAMAARYGWTDLSNARVVRGFDGYYIQLPKAKPLS